MATQGCDQSADAGAGMAGANELAPLKQAAQYSGPKAINPGSARAEPSQ